VGDLNKQLLAADHLDAPPKKILSSVCEMSGAQAGGFIAFHPQTQTPEVAAAHGLPKSRLRDLLRVSSRDVISSRNGAGAVLGLLAIYFQEKTEQSESQLQATRVWRRTVWSGSALNPHCAIASFSIARSSTILRIAS
jgi:hypothetical protein